MSLFNELKRRNVFKVAFAYIVVAWLVAQVLQLIFESFGTPEWVMKTVLVLMATGLLFALFFAWAFEMTPEGLKKESEVDRTQSITPHTGKKLNNLIVVVMGLALAYFAYDKFVLSAGRESAAVESAVQDATSQTLVDQSATQDATVEPDKSIAVLPFVNMSDDASNEYFSDGLSEEMLNLLAKIPELRVTSRSSTFAFKGEKIDIPAVAEKLGVAHILEGSVRKAGNRVRITAQLIEAQSDTHLWSETYDRSLDDIFAIQDEIAAAVVAQLKIALLGAPQADRMINPEAYTLNLKARHFALQRGAENIKKSEEALLQAIELEPGYAEAWASLAFSYYDQIKFNIKTYEEGVALAENAIERAKSLGPDQGVVWGIDGFLKKNLGWDWDAAQVAINKAYKLEPKQNDIRIWRASLANTMGKLDFALELYEQALLDDPLNLSAYSALGLAYRKLQRYDEAIVIFEKQIELKPDYYWAYFNLGKSYLFRGDAEQALLAIEKNPENVNRNVGLVMVYSTLGREAEAVAVLNRMVSEYGEQKPVWIAEAYSWRGQKDEAFDWLEKGLMQRSIGIAYLLGNTAFYPLTDDPRWAELLKKIDLFEYWQAMPPEYGGPTIPPS